MNPEQRSFLPFSPTLFFPLQNLEQTNKDDSMKLFFPNFVMFDEFVIQFFHQISQYSPLESPTLTNNEVVIVEDSIRSE